MLSMHESDFQRPARLKLLVLPQGFLIAKGYYPHQARIHNTDIHSTDLLSSPFLINLILGFLTMH